MEAKLREIESKRTYLDEKGIRSWLFTLDHKRIGLMYLFTILIFLLVGGLFAIIFRTELAFPGRQFLSPEAHNILFTLHGAMLTFLVIIPLIPSALGNFFLPIMIGAREVVFPRINLLSYWLFFTGALLLLFSLLLYSLQRKQGPERLYSIPCGIYTRHVFNFNGYEFHSDRSQAKGAGYDLGKTSPLRLGSIRYKLGSAPCDPRFGYNFAPAWNGESTWYRILRSRKGW